jgi:hypothetical protein
MIALVETVCPCCDEDLELTDFDPLDTEQEIECPECGTVFEEWVFTDGQLTLLPPEDEDDEDEDDEAELDSSDEPAPDGEEE